MVILGSYTKFAHRVPHDTPSDPLLIPYMASPPIPLKRSNLFVSSRLASSLLIEDVCSFPLYILTVFDPVVVTMARVACMVTVYNAAVVRFTLHVPNISTTRCGAAAHGVTGVTLLTFTLIVPLAMSATRTPRTTIKSSRIPIIHRPYDAVYVFPFSSAGYSVPTESCFVSMARAPTNGVLRRGRPSYVKELWPPEEIAAARRCSRDVICTDVARSTAYFAEQSYLSNTDDNTNLQSV